MNSLLTKLNLTVGTQVFISCLVALAMIIPVAAMPAAVSAAGVNSYCRTLTVNTGQAPSPQTDFPMLVKINDSTLADTGHGGHVANSSGSDIYFTNASGSVQYPCEIEKYDGAIGALVAWVKVPSLTDGTVVRMWYGGSGGSAIPPNWVWSYGFEGVWHMQHFPPSDSSLAQQTCLVTGNLSQGTEKINGTLNFPGNSQPAYIDITSGNDTTLVFQPTGSYTWEAWLNPAGAQSGGCGVIGKKNPASDSSGQGYEINLGDGTSTLYFQSSSNSTYQLASTANLTIGTWTHVAIVYNNTAVSMYLNGSLNNSGIIPSTADLANHLYIGYQRSGSTPGQGYFYGQMDQVTYSSAARSADWISAEYRNQNNPGTFYTLGAETAAPVAAFTANLTAGTAPLTVQFTDQSTHSPTAWSWDFNNDGTADSSQQNPAYIYTAAGIYTVKLTASNAAGSDDEIKTNYVTVGGIGPYTWYVDDSGGSTFTTIQAAVNTAKAGDTIIVKNGIYNENVTVNKTLVIQSENGAANVTVTATLPSLPVFMVTANSVILNGFTVSGATGSGVAGIEVTGSVSSQIENNRVTGCSIGIGLRDDSTGDTVLGNNCYGNSMYGLAIQDTAYGNSVNRNVFSSNYRDVYIQYTTSYNTLWLNDMQSSMPVDAGSNLVSHSPTQIHYIYNSQYWTNYLGNHYAVYIGSDNDGNGVGNSAYTYGTYTDSYPLIASFNSYIETDLVAPVAAFTGNVTSGEAPLTVQFTDQSTGNPASWAWDFTNNGSADSYVQNPVYTFISPGTYSVKLSVSNLAGSDDELKSSYIKAKAPVVYYTITASAGANGSIAPSGNVTVAEGTNQTFAINPNAGFLIADVLADGASVGRVSTYTFTNVAANHTIAASFSCNKEWPLQLIGYSTVSISKSEFEALPVSPGTYTDGNGNIFQGVDLWRLIAKVDDNDPATLNTSLLGTYMITFTGLNNNGTDYPKEVTSGNWSQAFASGNISSDDIFVANKVKLQGSGSFVELPLINPDSGKLWYPTVLTGNGVANSGGWRVGGLYKIQLTGLPVYYTIAASAGTGGAISPSGSVEVVQSGNQTFSISPNTGYNIQDVLVDSISQGAIASYTFTNVTANHTIAASFISKQNWPLQLSGYGTVNISKSDFEALAANYPSGNYTDSNGNIFQGVDLWRLIALVDDNDPATLNTSLLGTYKITLTGLNTNGTDYSKEITSGNWSQAFASGNITSDDIFVANKVKVHGTGDFVELPLTNPDSGKLWYPIVLTGNGVLSSGLRIGSLYKIQLSGFPVYYNISATAGSGGTINPSGNVTVIQSGNQTFNVAANTGFRISDVQVDSVSRGAVASYTFTNVTANHTIAASFASKQDWPLQIAGASTLNLSKTDFEALAAAYPSNVYESVDKFGVKDGYKWKGAALWRLIAKVDDVDPDTFNAALASKYSIKLWAADDYSKTIDPPYDTIFPFANNEDIFIANKVMVPGSSEWTDLPATSSSGKIWYPLMSTGAGCTAGNQRVGGLIKIELLSLPVTYTITATAGTGGAINPSGNLVVAQSGNQTFSIQADAGYSIKNVSVDGVSQGAVTSYTFTNISASHTISASFALIPVVNILVDPEGQAVASGETFIVDINIDTNTAARGWQLNVNYDPSRLIFKEVTEGGFLKEWAAAHGAGTVSVGLETIDSVSGRINNIAYIVTGNASAAGAIGSGTLCSIAFTAKTNLISSTTVSPSGIVVADVDGGAINLKTVRGGTIYIGQPYGNRLKFMLKTGWNTFSTPISLDVDHNTIDEILADVECDIVYRFDPQTQAWVIPPAGYQVKSCDAFYVHLKSDAVISLHINSNLTPPPSKSLLAGWNLISLANLTAMKASDALLSAAMVTGDLSGYTLVLSQAVGNQDSWVYLKGQSIPDSGSFAWMWPGKGYWVFMVNPGTLAGFTLTPLP